MALSTKGAEIIRSLPKRNRKRLRITKLKGLGEAPERSEMILNFRFIPKLFGEYYPWQD